MAADTIVVEVIDFTVLFLHFRLVVFMAAVAGIGTVIAAGMAQLALLICPAMVQRKRVFEAGWFPGIGAVTLRALAAKMIIRPISGVTGDTISCASCPMVEAGWQPATRVMACRALRGIVVSGFIVIMARNTIRSPCYCVVESRWFPGIGAVAGGANAWEMVGWQIDKMAGVAVLGICA